MASFWEPEEFVGGIWHRLVGSASSYPRHPQAAVRLDEMRTRLGRAVPGVRRPRCRPPRRGCGRDIRTPPGSIQRLGLGTEKLERARYDGATLQLPDSIDVFPERADNAALFEWLAAFFAHADAAPVYPSDPLQADLVRLRAAARTTERAIAEWPGLRTLHERLCQALLQVRPRRSLSGQEAAVEALVIKLIGGDASPNPEMLAAVTDTTFRSTISGQRRDTTPFCRFRCGARSSSRGREPRRQRVMRIGGAGSEGDGKRRKASRRENDQTRRDDPLMLNRFEKILGLAEMVNLNRKTEEDDEEDAKKAAEDLDEISLGQHERKVSTRLKLDLELSAGEADVEPIRAEVTYPEWDWKRRRHHLHHCRVIAEPASLEGDEWRPDEDALRRIRLVRRQFEAMRPRRQLMTGQPDGDDLDLSALVRSVADRRAGGIGSDRVYTAVRTVARDLSVCVLVDVSLSTDSYVEERRVLDVEKEALLALTHGLSACGDEHAILTFTSHRRQRVDIRMVKDFEERLGPRVVRRIQALKPGSYTRMGAAIRHATALLEKRPQTHRLLLVLTDGKPNDIDHYEGRYAIEDTRVAVQEARRAGLRLFGVTVDAQGRDYLPYIFGPGPYAIFPHVARLPRRFPLSTAS